MLDEAKAKSERHKSSWFAYKWFWQEVYLVAMLSLYRASLFNKSEMGWSFDDESTRASPDVYGKHDRIILMIRSCSAYLTRVKRPIWQLMVFYNWRKVFRIEVNVFDILFYFSDKILYCGAIQIEDTWKSGIQMWLSHNQGNLMYTDVNKCLYLDFFAKVLKGSI